MNEISNKDRIIIYFNVGLKVLRGLWYRMFLKQAKGLFLVGKYVRISHGKHIICGRNVKFEDFSEIQGLCKDGLFFDDNVTIGRGVMIRPSSYYGKDLGEGLVVGKNSAIGPYGYVGCSGKIVIGENVMLGPKCSLFGENHVFSDSSVPIKVQGVKKIGINIGDDCWIGSNCIILDGVTIGKGCVTGAGTLITKDVPPGRIVMDKRNKTIQER